MSHKQRNLKPSLTICSLSLWTGRCHDSNYGRFCRGISVPHKHTVGLTREFLPTRLPQQNAQTNPTDIISLPPLLRPSALYAATVFACDFSSQVLFAFNWANQDTQFVDRIHHGRSPLSRDESKAIPPNDLVHRSLCGRIHFGN